MERQDHAMARNKVYPLSLQSGDILPLGSNSNKQSDRQTDRQTDRQVHRQTVGQKDGQVDGQMNGQTDGLGVRWTNR